MKERPILFQGDMVRALLAGTKTQTRREVKLPHMNPLGHWEPMDVGGPGGGRTRDGHTIPAQQSIWHTRTGDSMLCPYGQPGDRLWVREAWGYFDPDGGGQEFKEDGPASSFRDEMLEEGNALREYWRRRVAYRATWEEPKYGIGPAAPARWRPSIHMPRWASRIDLEITDVRVQRVQEISAEDARAEGINPLLSNPQEVYGSLWKQINGAGSWNANPWVWVVEFRKA